MSIVGLYRVPNTSQHPAEASTARGHLGDFPAVGTSLGYGGIDSALQSYRIHHGKIDQIIAQFIRAFKVTTNQDREEAEQFNMPKVEVLGYRFSRDLKTLYAGLRTIEDTENKIYDLPLARVNGDTTQTLIQRLAENTWETTNGDETYILKKLKLNNGTHYIKLEIINPNDPTKTSQTSPLKKSA